MDDYLIYRYDKDEVGDVGIAKAKIEINGKNVANKVLAKKGGSISIDSDA